MCRRAGGSGTLPCSAALLLRVRSQLEVGRGEEQVEDDGIADAQEDQRGALDPQSALWLGPS